MTETGGPKDGGDEPTASGKVLNILDGGKKKKKDKVHLRPVDIYASLAKAINGTYAGPEAHALPKWGPRYAVMEPSQGHRLTYVIDRAIEVMTHVPLSAVTGEIVCYTDDISSRLPELHLTVRQAGEAAQYWLARTPPIPSEDVKIVRWSDEPGLTYARLPWKRGAGPTPTWETILGRMTNREAFCDWIGSLLVEDSSRHDYLWIHGQGGDGKGSITTFLKKVFGPSFRSKHPPSRGGDRFWAYGLIGARVVALVDCDDSQFVSQGLFKSLTGGDSIDVEAKGAMSFTTELTAKFVIASQEKPAISSERADMRRLVYCELGAAPPKDPRFQDKLWNEGGAFLSGCLEGYLARYHDRGAIVCSAESIRELAEETEEPFITLFDEYFRLSPGGVVSSCDFNAVLENAWPHRRGTHRMFRRWFERTHGEHVRYLRDSKRFYRGMIRIKVPEASWRSGIRSDADRH